MNYRIYAKPIYSLLLSSLLFVHPLQGYFTHRLSRDQNTILQLILITATSWDLTCFFLSYKEHEAMIDESCIEMQKALRHVPGFKKFIGEAQANPCIELLAPLPLIWTWEPTVFSERSSDSSLSFLHGILYSKTGKILAVYGHGICAFRMLCVLINPKKYYQVNKATAAKIIRWFRSILPPFRSQ